MKSNTFWGRIFNKWPVKTLSILGAVLLFFFNNISELEQRFFNVPLQIQLNDEYMPNSDFPKNVRVRLRGTEENINAILEEDVVAYVDLTLRQEEGVYDVPVEIRRKGTALDLDEVEIRVEPLEVEISIEEKLTKSLAVIPTLKGFPAGGFELGQYFMTPSTVEAFGPRSIMEPFTSLQTEDIQLEGRREDFTERIRLVKSSDFINLPGGDIVEFRGFIQESIILQTFTDVDVISIDVPDDVELEDLSFNNSIKVQGKQSTLEAVTPGDIQMFVDFSEVTGPGVYVLPTRPAVPVGLIVLQYMPEEVEVVVGEQ